MTDGAGRGEGRWFLVVFALAVLLQASAAVARPMASYRALEIGMEPSTLGLVAAAYAIAPVIFALSIGRRIDRHGELPFLLGAAIMMSVSSLALVWVGSDVTLLVSIALLGLSQLVFVVANQTLIGSRSGVAAYDRRFGHLSFMASFGQLIGLASAGFIAADGTDAGTGRALVFGAGLALLSIPLIVQMWRTDPGPAIRPPDVVPEQPRLLEMLRVPGMGPAMLASLTVLSTIDVLVVYMPAFGEERGLSPATIGALLATRAGASMASRLVLGRLIEVIGRERLMIGSLVTAAASVIALPFLPLPMMFALMVVAGLTLGVCQPMTMSWVAARATANSRATAMSLRLLGNRLGQVAIPLAAGSLAAVAGTAGVMATAGMTIAVSAGVAISRRSKD